MYDNDSKGISFSAAFFILIALAIVMLMVADAINAQVWKSMTGINYDQILTATANPANARAYKVVQCLNAIIGFMVPTFIVAFLINRRPVRLIGLTTPVSGKQIVLVFMSSPEYFTLLCCVFSKPFVRR